MIDIDNYETKVRTLSINELVSEDTYLIIEGMTDIQQQSYREQLKLRAKELGLTLKTVDEQFKAVMRTIKKDYVEYRQEVENNKAIPLELNGRGYPAQTIENILRVMRNDNYFEGLKYNVLASSPEKHIDGNIERWSDFDDSNAKHYLESHYGLSNDTKYNHAINVLFTERSYHPIHDLIESIEWDGVSRIKTFLHKWVKCEDTPYTREVSRIIFAGGINRVYRPGCKFEDTPILIGTNQGEGKSTLVRWLAMDDRFFREVNDMDGQRGSEAVEGSWICEISELLALTKSKEVELVKSYISRQTETYRRAYDHRISDYPRQCIFIGTTNRSEFLTDKTGNRRFYPIRCNQVGYELFDHQQECQADIMQCWAEAYYLFNNKHEDAKPFFSRSLLQEARERQAEATEEDYRIGLIQQYVKGKHQICTIEIWEKALGNFYTKPSRKDSMEIGQLLDQLEDFNKNPNPVRFADYGLQRCWVRIKNFM